MASLFELHFHLIELNHLQFLDLKDVVLLLEFLSFTILISWTHLPRTLRISLWWITPSQNVFFFFILELRDITCLDSWGSRHPLCGHPNLHLFSFRAHPSATSLGEHPFIYTIFSLPSYLYGQSIAVCSLQFMQLQRIHKIPFLSHHF